MIRYGFQTPVRLMTWPTAVEAISRPAISGMVSSPDTVGDSPRESCMYWLR